MTVYGGAPVLAADVNRALNRRYGTSIAVTNGTATNVSTGAEIVIDTVTTDSLTAGSRYMITAVVPVTGSVAADRYDIRLRQGSTTAAAQLTYERVTVPAAGNVVTAHLSCDFTPTADGPVTFCTTIARQAGTGTGTPQGASSLQRLLVVDLVNT